MRFWLFFCAANERTNFFFDMWIYMMSSREKLQKAPLPSTHTLFNVPDTLVVKYKTVMLYTIVLVVLIVLIFLLFLCELFGSERTQSISVSHIFVLTLARHSNISCTGIYSPYDADDYYYRKSSHKLRGSLL